MSKNILITGASGSVGKRLTSLLLDKGYQVSALSRTPGQNPAVKTFIWNVNQGIIDECCIDGIDTIIHLAGAGIAEKRWTNTRKKELIDSRTKSIGLIYDLLKTRQHQVNLVIFGIV